ncbi:hypothetical protein [Chryseobacterium wangxinyae]|uniref:hypothetical protein n=1 Tax=Chryseobacterium sp. CY353 TaxID=2997334 RepID=UPI0022704D65|nr:hypothetical protein [Chryseobacterium sp. CY353]MCY0967897.1 hypothetical protein [Chryseobacterium sp. CY353]
MSALEKEIQALRMKQSRIEKKQREENAEVWDRIEKLELLTKAEESGVDAANKLSPAVQLLANQAARRRGWKNF